MTDRITREQRSKIMSRIRSRNTRPELIVRRFLWSKGYRYRLFVSKLPGRPDIVLGRLKVAIFVNGCFWHAHSTHKVSVPTSNAEYWTKKIETNKKRDFENGVKLRQMGWTVIVIWECELTKKRRSETLDKLAETLRLLDNNPYTRSEQQDLNVAAEPQFDYSPS